MLHWKSKDQLNLRVKPKVFFSCHPEDFPLYFDLLSGDLLSAVDCCIYYDSEPELAGEERASMLAEMNLLVFPITRKFLTEPSSDLAFARSRGIPILPIMMERHLAGRFNAVCEETQFLDRTDIDPTAIPYPRKLQDFLSRVLISDELAQKVRSAFDAYIFLSYRKKDRRHAQELMRLIHSNPFARDIAIWYDEFLQPGENFNDSIFAALTKSDLFALAVTPNLVNEPNYVMNEEYPAARKSGKPILPFTLVPTDPDALKRSYADLPDCVNVRDRAGVSDALLRAIQNLARQPHEHDSRHNYFIALAYLHGIDVEIDREKALELLASSAEAGLPEAADQLVDLYYHGIFVGRDYAQAGIWQQRKIEILRSQPDLTPAAQLDLADALRLMADLLTNTLDPTGDQRARAIACSEEALHICEQLDPAEDESRLLECKLASLRRLAVSYEDAEDFEKAEQYYRLALQLRKALAQLDERQNNDALHTKNQYYIAQLYQDLGILYRRKHDYRASVDALTKAIAIHNQILKSTAVFLPNLAGVYRMLSASWEFLNPQEAKKYALKELEICRELYAEDPAQHERAYANALHDCACRLSNLRLAADPELEEMFLTALPLLEKHTEDHVYETSFTYMVALYKLANICARKFDHAQAEEYFTRSIEVLQQIRAVDSELNLAQAGDIYFDFGVFSMKNPRNKNFSTAKANIRKALELFQTLQEQYPCQKYTQYIQESTALLQYLETLEPQDDAPSVSEEEPQTNPFEEEFGKYLYNLSNGDRSEKNGDFQSACFFYNAAAQHMEALEQASGQTFRLEKADLYDRLAYCHEERKELTKAESYYKQAVLCALTEAQTSDELEVKQKIALYLDKLAGFYRDCGAKAAAHSSYKMLIGIRKQILRKENSIGSMDDLADTLYYTYLTSPEPSDHADLDLCITIWEQLRREDPENFMYYLKRLTKAKGLLQNLQS